MTAPLRGLVVRQPWATLAVLGIKTILDLPRRPKVERGETIAIVAGKARPIAALPEYGERGGGGYFDYGQNDDGSWWMAWGEETEPLGAPLPLGAVVGLVTVDDALPIVRSEVADCDARQLHLTTNADGTRRLWDATTRSRTVVDADCTELSGQLPLGDFTEGRWGLLLSNPRPCDPVPVKGAQGVFTLPDDVTKRIGGGR